MAGPRKLDDAALHAVIGGATGYHNQVVGSNDADLLLGSWQDDHIAGLGGDDVILDLGSLEQGIADRDIIDGGSGHDKLVLFATPDQLQVTLTTPNGPVTVSPTQDPATGSYVFTGFPPDASGVITMGDRQIRFTSIETIRLVQELPQDLVG